MPLRFQHSVEELVPILPHVNAALNSVATVLLISGLLLIQQGHERAHKRAMVAAFAVSVLFLASYLTYHTALRSLSLSEKRLPTDVAPAIRYSYYAMLISHIVLAATVPVLAILSLWSGWTDQRVRHRRLVKWAFPIWLYVSVTGVLIYLVLYQIYRV